MQTTTTQAETSDFSCLLRKGEEILWHEPRRQMMEPAVVYLLFSAAVLLAIYGMMVWESLSPGGLGKDDTLHMLFIPGISLVSILLAVVVVMRNRRMVYVLTRQRAIICHRGFRGWVIDEEAPVSRNLILNLFRAANGTADYIFEIHRFRRVQLPVGFIGVRSVQELETRLTCCGVRIPKPENPAAKAARPPSASRLFFAFAAFAALLSFCIHESRTDTALILTLHGEPAMATVVTHRPIVVRETRSSGGPLLRHHPVLQFSPAPGSTVIAVDLLSDESPAGQPGDQVEILYYPQNPTLAMRATSHRFERPAILLAFLLGLLGYFLNGIRQRYLHRQR
ncbi:MAG: hypothetical protein J6R92_06395 [Akkermansia sp.]|nr:hypothetical protein [Akkermansia sp.]